MKSLKLESLCLSWKEPSDVRKIFPKLVSFAEVFPTLAVTFQFQLNFPTSSRTFQLHSFQFYVELSNFSFFQLPFPTTRIPLKNAKSPNKEQSVRRLGTFYIIQKFQFWFVPPKDSCTIEYFSKVEELIWKPKLFPMNKNLVTSHRRFLKVWLYDSYNMSKNVVVKVLLSLKNAVIGSI